MTLEEQWENGLSPEEKQSYEEIVTNAIPVLGLDLGPIKAYIEWLEEKLTWKKFRDQKPKPDSAVLVKFDGSVVVYKFLSSSTADQYLKAYPESEWMYVPE